MVRGEISNQEFQQSPCQKAAVQNCRIYESFSKCILCEEYFHLSENGDCIPDPLPLIPHCEIYSNYNICQSCKQGYLLGSSDQCEEVTEIANCLFYDTTVNLNMCIECEESYYVLSNQCVERQNNINLCSIYTLNEDNCSQCQDNYLLTTDYLLCLPSILNCATYVQSNSQNEVLECETCDIGFYLDSNACLPGTIINCEAYSAADTCSRCVNGYYWGNDVEGVKGCQPHQTIKYCETYSQTTPHKCSLCDNTHVHYYQTNACQEIPVLIEHCEAYDTITTCLQCVEGYERNTNTSCKQIAESEHCIYKNQGSTACSICKDNYILKNGTCQLPMDFQLENCHTYSATTTSEKLTCEKCSQYSLYMNFDLSFLNCINDVENDTYYQGSTITNCVMHTSTNNTSTPKCLRCKDGYYPNESQTACVTSCSNQLLRKYYTTPYGNTINLSRCVNAAIADCLEVAPVLVDDSNTNDTNLVCVKCKQGFIKIIADQPYPFVSENTANLTSDYPIGVERLGFKCETSTAKVYTTTNTSVAPTNCFIFRINAITTKLDCRMCIYGYTGTVDPVNAENVICSSSINDCNTDVYYGGLFQFAHQKAKDTFRHLTCHQCLSQGRIPILFLDQNLERSAFGIEYGLETLEDAITKDGKVLQCIEPSAKHFKIPEDKYDALFIQNCAVGLFYTDIEIDYRNFAQENPGDKTVLECLHCKPGFRSLFENNIIVKCEKIDHCSVDDRKNKWFNGCNQCQYGYAWQVVYNLNTPVIYYDRCVWTKGDAHCLAFSEEPNLGINCVFCENGYTLNGDGICEQIQAPLCEDGQTFYTSLNYDNLNENHNYFYFEYSQINGCFSCQNDYYPYSVDNTSYDTCFESPYILKDDFPSTTTFVPHCKFYDGTAIDYTVFPWQHKCNQCKVSYILDEDNEACVSLDSYPRCQIADLQNDKCHTCQEGFVNIDGYCEKPSIRYCEIYANNEIFQKCLQCISTYQLVDNLCVKGRVHNCDQYNGNDCLNCLEGFYLIEGLDTQMCLEEITDFNCYVSTLNSSLGAWFCQSCLEGYVKITTTSELNISYCAPIETIDNCISYDNLSKITDSTFRCEECEEGFFLDENQCRPRLNKPEGCISFVPERDFCDGCQIGMYLDNDKQCREYPIGQYKCQKYNLYNICEMCSEQYYLESGECIEVPEEKRIEQCKYYFNENECQQCYRNYYLADNSCIESIAKNCATYISIRECEKCLGNHGFYKDETGNVSCVFISTQNCQQTTDFYPFDCIKCNTLYYLQNGKCFANELYIDNCQDYDSATTCAKCYSGFMLSPNKKDCIDENEFGYSALLNCTNNQLTSFPQCIICKTGYYNKNGECLECKIYTNSVGCMQCNVQDDVEVCLLCQAGYFMNELAECQLNGEANAVQPPVDTTDTTTNTNDPTNTNTDTTTQTTTNTNNLAH